jgi:hypothetical protein
MSVDQRIFQYLEQLNECNIRINKLQRKKKQIENELMDCMERTNKKQITANGRKYRIARRLPKFDISQKYASGFLNKYINDSKNVSNIAKYVYSNSKDVYLDRLKFILNDIKIAETIHYEIMSTRPESKERYLDNIASVKQVRNK